MRFASHSNQSRIHVGLITYKSIPAHLVNENQLIGVFHGLYCLWQALLIEMVVIKTIQERIGSMHCDSEWTNLVRHVTAGSPCPDA